MSYTKLCNSAGSDNVMYTPCGSSVMTDDTVSSIVDQTMADEEEPSWDWQKLIV